MLQCHLLNVRAQKKYLKPVWTQFMFMWFPSVILDRSEWVILLVKQR